MLTAAQEAVANHLQRGVCFVALKLGVSLNYKIWATITATELITVSFRLYARWDREIGTDTARYRIVTEVGGRKASFSGDAAVIENAARVSGGHAYAASLWLPETADLLRPEVVLTAAHSTVQVAGLSWQMVQS